MKIFSQARGEEIKLMLGQPTEGEGMYKNLKDLQQLLEKQTARLHGLENERIGLLHRWAAADRIFDYSAGQPEKETKILRCILTILR